MQKPYESLKYFYLGGDKDKNPFLYENKDLTTHALIIGMTGSGKTGLGVGLIEEASIDNIPSIVIDPKGDMGNLLLAFPNLSADEFEPWIDESEAAKKSITKSESAKSTATMWQNGLKSWDQDSERVAKFKDSADFTIYTPGASHGVSISVLNSFNAPSKELASDNDFLNQLISSTVTGLLSFVGIDADPLTSKEHILLSTIFMKKYQNGEDLSMEELITSIINPPFKKIGVFSLEEFFTHADRVKLAMKINLVIASPTFASWCEGAPLDIDRLLFTKDGKARVSIFSISHLSDGERMFFVTLLLNAVIGWMRGLDGTSALRAIIYMDEIFGFFPPNANPPSKTPMLTLLKQARAFGVGVVLSTQNPVDLDYKGLSNIGTWFVGRLQTNQDKERVIDGLSGVTGSQLSKNDLMSLISNLNKRNFLTKNIHQDGLKIIETRWALSYLKGPLSREQISTLMKDKKESTKVTNLSDIKSGETILKKPIISTKIEEAYYYESMSQAPRLYPMLLVISKAKFINVKKGVDKEIGVTLLSSASKNDTTLSWSDKVDINTNKLLKEEREKAEYEELSSFVSTQKELDKVVSNVTDFICRNVTLTLFSAPSLKLNSNQDESIEAFRQRVQTRLNELIDEGSKKLKDDFDKKYRVLEQKLIRANTKLEKEKNDMRSKTLDTAISIGSSILGMLFGKSKLTSSKASTSARSANRALKERDDVIRAEDEMALIQNDIETLKEKFSDDANALGERYKMENIEVKEDNITLRKSDIYDVKVTLLWKEI